MNTTNLQVESKQGKSLGSLSCFRMRIYRAHSEQPNLHTNICNAQHNAGCLLLLAKALAAADPPALPVEKMPVKVFGSPTSAEVARVLACLFEKDVEFQLIRVDSFRGPKRLPQYLKLQPHGEALTFEDGNVTLVESRKILRHIAEKYKNQGNRELFGPGALERASIEQWLQTEAQSFDIPSADMVYSLAYLPPDMPLDGSRGGGGLGLPAAAAGPGMNPTHRQKMEETLQLFDKSRKELSKLLDIYEQRLGEEAFLAGTKFTLADLSHLPNADRLTADPRSARLIQSRRNVSRWWDTISRRDSWTRVKELQRPPSAEAPF